jgi:hypothetical protein
MTTDGTGTLHEVHREPLRAYPHLVACFVYHAAIKIVKRQIQARGEKLVEYSAKDLRIRAEAYVEANRAELIAKTIEAIRTTPAFRSLAEKEARRRGRMWPLEATSIRRGPSKRVLPLDVINDPKLFPA